MDPVLAAVRMEYLVIPVIRELASRRNVHGVNEETLGAFIKNPKAVINELKKNPALREKVKTDLADVIDNIASDGVDAILALFAAVTPGGPGNEHTDD